MHAGIALAIVAQAVVMAFLGAPAAAQSLDGTYNGTLTCESIAGTTQRPLRGTFKLTVNGTAATYEREIRSSTDQPTGMYERGKGSITPAGAITLTGAGQIGGSNVTASYTGSISGGVARLSGTQNWTKSGERKCTIEVRMGR